MAARSTTIDTLEQLYLYGVITKDYQKTGSTYTYFLTGTGLRKENQTTAQVKAFASGALAVLFALNNDNIKVTARRTFIPEAYNYGYTLTQLLAAAERQYEIPLENSSSSSS